jgi:hypothetical protein
VQPNSPSRAFIPGSARAAFVSLLSLSTIAIGVFLGAAKPVQSLASKPGTYSAAVGMSGSASNRAALVAASGTSFPAQSSKPVAPRGSELPRQVGAKHHALLGQRRPGHFSVRSLPLRENGAPRVARAPIGSAQLNQLARRDSRLLSITAIPGTKNEVDTAPMGCGTDN